MKPLVPLSFSSLKEYSKSPAHFLAYKRAERKSSPAQDLGRLVHSLILEPDTVEKTYAIAPKLDKRTSLGRQAWERFEFENTGKTVVSSDAFDKAVMMRAAVMGNEDARDLILGCTKYEHHVEGELYGVDFHGFIDGLCEDDGYFLDLKTTQDHSPSAFSRTVASYKYYLQAAVYEALTGISDAYFIAIESEDPNCVVVYQLSQTYMDAGRYELEALTKSFKMWMEEGAPARPSVNTIQTIYPPSWML